MKKTILLTLIGVLTAVILSACSGGKYIENEKFTEYVTEEVSLDKEDEFIIYAFARSCAHCSKFKPVLKKYLEKDDALNIYAYDVDDEKTNPFILSLSEELGFKFEGTPTTIYIKDGKLANYFVGTIDLEQIPVKGSSVNNDIEKGSSNATEVDLESKGD